MITLLLNSPEGFTPAAWLQPTQKDKGERKGSHHEGQLEEYGKCIALVSQAEDSSG